MSEGYTIHQKPEKYGKLEKNVLKLKSEEKVSESSELLDKLLTMQKYHKEKEGLDFFDELLNQNGKGKGKEKVEVEKKPEDSTKVLNPGLVENRPLIW